MKDNNKKKNVYDYIDKAGYIIKKGLPYVAGTLAFIAIISGKGKDGGNKA